MKEIVILRHGEWNAPDDVLTDNARRKCYKLQPFLGSFSIVLSSLTNRTQETAALLTGSQAVTDKRAGILQSPPELSAKVLELRKTHPLGVAGAIISIPELREPLQRQGEAFKTLLDETFDSLSDGERALVVSHDGTMVALEKVLTRSSFDTLEHTYGELEGFRVNQAFELSEFK